MCKKKIGQNSSYYSSNTSPVYTNWASGEPNNAGGENCALMWPHTSQLKWNDAPCNHQVSAICQRGTNPPSIKTSSLMAPLKFN